MRLAGYSLPHSRRQMPFTMSAGTLKSLRCTSSICCQTYGNRYGDSQFKAQTIDGVEDSALFFCERVTSRNKTDTLFMHCTVSIV